MKIGIDIDDTITKTIEEVDIWAKEYTEKVLKKEFKMKTTEILEPMWAKFLYGWNEEEDRNFWDLYYEEIMKNVKPKDDAIEIINKLSKNNNIIIITARWDREDKSIEKITQNWFEKYKIKYNKIFLGHQDKRQIVKENNIEIFIDDNFQTCKQISELNVRTLLMDTRLNKNIEDSNMERVFSWKDIKEKIKD